jgi:hypothetical protein
MAVIVPDESITLDTPLASYNAEFSIKYMVSTPPTESRQSIAYPAVIAQLGIIYYFYFILKLRIICFYYSK